MSRKIQTPHIHTIHTVHNYLIKINQLYKAAALQGRTMREMHIGCMSRSCGLHLSECGGRRRGLDGHRQSNVYLTVHIFSVQRISWAMIKMLCSHRQINFIAGRPKRKGAIFFFQKRTEETNHEDITNYWINSNPVLCLQRWSDNPIGDNLWLQNLYCWRLKIKASMWMLKAWFILQPTFIRQMFASQLQPFNLL